ncbi:EAL domain-containing protein [Salinivibrio sp. IB643]|uniref:EAL domain-containing protein n=1 Tax=Salinivibrio sp. IB643 TaxID=1909445 RepID=UPI00098904A5|nr:EAL domain-containing protein [Salinivibrio sp. IB643]OOE96747.1 hypothetical protein BZG77_10940 [Salinivibrio sp. IB643]
MHALQSRQPLIWGATLLALLALSTFGVWIADLSEGTTEEQPLLDVNYSYFVDETNELSLDYVMAHAPFTSVSEPTHIPWKLAYQTYWINIGFDYTGLTERPIHVITDNPSIDYLDAYHVLDGEQIRSRVKAGDITPERLNRLPLPSSVPVTLLPEHANQLLIKVTSRDMATMPLWVMDHGRYDHFAKSLHLVWGGFMSFAMLMALYSAGVYVYSRQRVYLIYVFATVLSALVVSVNHGFSRYFFPDFIQIFISNHLVALTVCLLTVGLWFTYFFLDFTRSPIHQRARSLFLITTGGLLGLALLSFITPAYMSASFVLIAQIPVYGVIIYYLWQQWQPSKYWLFLFILCWLPAMAGGLTFYALMLNYIEYTLLSSYVLMLALALTMILFSLALAERFRFQRMQEMRALTHDTLSCLPNNNVLHMVISDLISRNNNFNLCCLSIDNYSNLLPYLDESARDEYINAIAARMNDTLAVQPVQAIKTDSDMPNHRLGCLKEGVFAFLIEDVDLKTCDQVLTAVVDSLNGDLCVGSFVTQVNVRIGVCHYPTDGDHPGLLISRALNAIDQHRRFAGNYAHFNSHEQRDHQLHVSLVTDLRDAIENDGLELYHQPQIDLRTGSIHGSEVLARWTHPEYGQISPEVFVRMAEDVGIINSLTLWVIKRAFQQQAQLINRGHCRRLSVNISASDIYIPDLANHVVELAREYHIPTNLISLELTESIMVEDYNWLKQLIEDLSANGIEVSTDDYGTGYSSLYFLSQLPFTELKIDRSFVRDLPKSSRHQSIVRATTDMARSLGVMVVAEGVESEEAESLLRRYGVAVSQGYYYSRPLPFSQYQAYVERMDSAQPSTVIRERNRRSTSG